ncbi:hypothetical protein [Acinetobacter sp. ANC 5414]|uniref:hypothetical protein n=1 Tax=Acinetobacter sp. ANC 5414 TaxID=2731251 RepID=UPI00148F8176|nr:hypothetical protein [Acinetobacter sp. ANC 5414]NNH00196.1 hypothetical protein [Acinetobacter sp. ANC 5414]
MKDYPLVTGETDQDLLNIYSQICDKKNKKNIALQNELLIQAAQKYQQLGKNLKALQLIESLSQQNVQRTALTDVAFLAGVGIAESYLQLMRSNEVRYLNAQTTYPAAKKLSDHIHLSLPEPDTSKTQAITDTSIKQKKISKTTFNKSASLNRSAYKTTQVNHPKNINAQPKTVKAPTRNTIAATKSKNGNTTTSGSSPFASFNKN